jgi:hypothetical protein
MKEKFKKFIFNEKIIFIFFVVLVFGVYRQLFQSYFEADEWFHFTHYLPLLKEEYGVLTAVTKSVTDTVALSEGQHVVPIGEEIFFLNTKFFGINFVPYAFISLLLHSINSFMVVILIKELLKGKKQTFTNIFAIAGGIFFALSAVPMHAVTWAAFYGQNVLSVTFFILSILFLKKALNYKNKKYLILSSIFLLLDLLTKETAVVLILILPIMIIIEKRVFSIKYLAKVYSIPLIFFSIFRFLIPALYFWIIQWVNASLPLTGQITSSQIVQKGADLSVVIYRIITFPLSMLSQVFIPSATMFSIMKIITPFIYYQYPGEPEVRGQYRQFFIYGPGNNLLFYLVALVLIILIISLIRSHFKKKKIDEAKTLLIGFSIIIIGALPLVLNVLYMPWWGTEYFDSRHYYMPTVGAAIVFPFILLAVGNFISKAMSLIRISIPYYSVALLIFVIWLINNMNVFRTNMNIIIDQTGYPRREIISQMKQHLPILPQKAVIYSETDGKSAYGKLLPFQTSFPQILTVVYYPFPDSFYERFIFDAKPEGYFFSEGRGLGYYNSKKTLQEALLENKFSVNDIYGFYYDSQNIKLKNITQSLRSEMELFLDKNEE